MRHLMVCPGDGPSCNAASGAGGRDKQLLPTHLLARVANYLSPNDKTCNARLVCKELHDHLRDHCNAAFSPSMDASSALAALCHPELKRRLNWYNKVHLRLLESAVSACACEADLQRLSSCVRQAVSERPDTFAPFAHISIHLATHAVEHGSPLVMALMLDHDWAVQHGELFRTHSRDPTPTQDLHRLLSYAARQPFRPRSACWLLHRERLLHTAARSGTAATLRRLLASPLMAGARLDPELLTLAAAAGTSPGPGPASGCVQGTQAAFCAPPCDVAHKVSLLLAAGCPPSPQALELAAGRGDWASLRALQGAGCGPTLGAVRLAMRGLRLDMAQWLMGGGGDKRAQGGCSSGTGGEGATAVASVPTAAASRTNSGSSRASSTCGAFSRTNSGSSRGSTSSSTSGAADCRAGVGRDGGGGGFLSLADDPRVLQAALAGLCEGRRWHAMEWLLLEWMAAQGGGQGAGGRGPPMALVEAVQGAYRRLVRARLGAGALGEQEACALAGDLWRELEHAAAGDGEGAAAVREGAGRGWVQCIGC